jgi:hypothetical protein
VIEPMLSSVPDPFDAYGPAPAPDQIFSILAPLSLSRTTSEAGTADTPASASTWAHVGSGGYFASAGGGGGGGDGPAAWAEADGEGPATPTTPRRLSTIASADEGSTLAANGWLTHSREASTIRHSGGPDEAEDERSRSPFSRDEGLGPDRTRSPLSDDTERAVAVS